MTGESLADTDHVARYCSPTRAENGLPTTAAFEPQEGENYVSVNWLEFFDGVDTAAKIGQVRDVVGRKLTLRPKGLFAVISVHEAKVAISDAELRIDHIPTVDDPSHAGIYTQENLDIAVELRALVTLGDVHPAVLVPSTGPPVAA